MNSVLVFLPQLQRPQGKRVPVSEMAGATVLVTLSLEPWMTVIPSKWSVNFTDSMRPYIPWNPKHLFDAGRRGIHNPVLPQCLCEPLCAVKVRRRTDEGRIRPIRRFARKLVCSVHNVTALIIACRQNGILINREQFKSPN